MIEVEHLTKRYGDFTAVSDLSFTIDKGQIYGFLGPNGAGKSTTMNIMTGCLAATSGQVKIGGFDIFEQPKEAKKQIGYLPEMPPLYVDQTPREYLEFVAMAKGIKSKADRKAAIERAIAETHIETMTDRLIKKLSKGYKQRVGIAQALLGDPEIIILDEPTVGLDPVQIIEIRDLIKELGEKHTVILSSHILSEVQAICDMVLIINHGKLVAYDRTENLGKGLSSGAIIDLCAEATVDDLKSILGSIDSITGIELKEETAIGCTVRITTNDEDVKAETKKIFTAMVEADKAVLTLNPVKASLEDIFIELTGDDTGSQRESENPEERLFRKKEEEVPHMEEGSFTEEELAQLAESMGADGNEAGEYGDLDDIEAGAQAMVDSAENESTDKEAE